jgi:hypothetical protein
MTEANESLRRVKPVLLSNGEMRSESERFFGAVVLSAGRRSLQRLSWDVQRHDIVPSRTAGERSQPHRDIAGRSNDRRIAPGYEASGWQGIGAPANTRPRGRAAERG